MSIRLPETHEFAGGRTCSACGEFKTIDNFAVFKDSRWVGGIGVNSKCKPCAYKAKIPGEIRRRYGITIDQYWEMYNAQGGGCAICGSEHYQSKRSQEYLPLFIDHCHDTGQVRGLLCSKCNHGIGLFNDSPDLLDQAIQYLLMSSAPRPDAR